MSRKIVRNAIRCNRCGVVAESRGVHHMAWCQCGAVAADGGREYLKRLGDPDDYEELAEYAPETP